MGSEDNLKACFGILDGIGIVRVDAGHQGPSEAQSAGDAVRQGKGQWHVLISPDRPSVEHMNGVRRAFKCSGVVLKDLPVANGFNWFGLVAATSEVRREGSLSHRANQARSGARGQVTQAMNNQRR
jgi:hypothetical protein